MTKRLQVLLDDDELAGIQALARQHRQTTSAWVRDAIRAARAAAEHPTVDTKLRVIREATAFAYPTGEIDDILAETEQGYLIDARLPLTFDRAFDGIPGIERFGA